MKKNNNYLITNLRAIAIMMVIIGHSIIIYDTTWTFYSTPNNSIILESIKHVINIFQMPLFFSISGFCFYYSKKLNIKKKVKRLIIPFIVIFLFWVVPFRIISNYPLYIDNNLFEIILKGIIGKDCGHLWYIMSLFEMYIMYDFIVKINKKYISISFTVLVFILSWKVSIFPNIFQLQSTFKYFIYFIIGYELNKCSFKISKKTCIVILEIIIVLLVLYLLGIFKNKILLKLFETSCTLLMLLFLYNMVSNKEYKVASYISDNSFGLYLLHSPMLYPIFNYASDINIVIMLLNNIIIIPFICLIIIYYIRKLKIGFIIGE